MNKPHRLPPCQFGNGLGRHHVEPSCHLRVKFARFQSAVANGVQHGSKAINPTEITQTIHVVGIEGDDPLSLESKGLVWADANDLPWVFVPEVKKGIVPRDSRDSRDEQRQAQTSVLRPDSLCWATECQSTVSVIIVRSGQSFRNGLAIANEPELPLDVVKFSPGIDTHQVKNGGREVRDRDGPFFGIGSISIR